MASMAGKASLIDTEARGRPRLHHLKIAVVGIVEEGHPLGIMEGSAGAFEGHPCGAGGHHAYGGHDGSSSVWCCWSP